MKKGGRHTYISLDLPDETAALDLAQKIADACGSTVSVMDSVGVSVGAKVQGSLNRAVDIPAIQKMADDVDAKIKK
jgi:hypothetical protein